MKFEENPGSEHPYEVTFIGEEIKVIASAFSEHIYQLALRGNIGSVSLFEAALAGWEPTRKGQKASIGRAEDLTEVLDSFHENTGDAITSMPGDINVPAFANRYIAKRHQLGTKALELADQIREEHAVSELRIGLAGDSSAVAEE
jgi:hypothetical protein